MQWIEPLLLSPVQHKGGVPKMRLATEIQNVPAAQLRDFARAPALRKDG
jgi:hypothetical protein